MRDPNQIPIGALSLQPETHWLGGTFFSRKGISNCSLVSRDAPQTSDKSWEDSPAERKRRDQDGVPGGRGSERRRTTFQQQMAWPQSTSALPALGPSGRAGPAWDLSLGHSPASRLEGSSDGRSPGPRGAASSPLLLDKGWRTAPLPLQRGAPVPAPTRSGSKPHPPQRPEPRQAAADSPTHNTTSDPVFPASAEASLPPSLGPNG